VAENHPEKIFKVFLKSSSVENEDHMPLAEGLELSEDQTKEFKDIFRNLVKLFFEKDLSLVEINPLVLNGSDHLVCLDGKINIDSNALFRQDEILELRDISQEEEKELRASEWDLNYVSLEGDIGCLVNGAGLAMATMDIIKLAGGEPANFLDVGGAVDEKRVAEAFKIILEDENVKAILVNIFGGIVRCDVVADGIISAVEGVGVDVPVVVRLKGNNSEIAKEMLGKTNLNIIAASELSEAAEKAAEIVK
jgi:succinyl-CoA synthetase beta subunit